MKKAFRYRIFPSKSTITKLNETLNICRRLYNESLNHNINTYKCNKKHLTKFDMTYWLVEQKKTIEMLKDVHSQVLQNVEERLDSAFKGFFRRIKSMGGEKAGFPRFQGENRYNSFTFTQSGFKIENDKLYLSKIGWMKIKVHRPLKGKIKRLTVRRMPTGKWYACFTCEVEEVRLPKNNSAIAFDLGVKSFATDNNGNEISYPYYYKKAQKNLAKLQRKHSKTKVKRYRKALNKAHEKVVNRRKNFHHQLSRKIVNENDTIVFEKLNVKALQHKHWVSKEIADASWSTFTNYVSYKAEWAGRNVVFVNPAYTSQTCSNCGLIVEKSLSERTHKCSCGLEIGRDHNAAINILRLGTQALGRL